MVLKTFNYKRGEVYLVEESNQIGSEIKKTRPWILVGSTLINKARKTLIAIPLSTQAPEIPNLTIKIHLNGIHSCAIIDQIRALDKKRFLRYEGKLEACEMAMIGEGLKTVLCLNKQSL